MAASQPTEPQSTQPNDGALTRSDDWGNQPMGLLRRHQSYSKYYKARYDDINCRVEFPLPTVILVWLDACLPSPDSAPANVVYLVRHTGEDAPLKTQPVYADVMHANIKIMDALEKLMVEMSMNRRGLTKLHQLKKWTSELLGPSGFTTARCGLFVLGGDIYRYDVHENDGSLKLEKKGSWVLWVEKQQLQC